MTTTATKTLGQANLRQLKREVQRLEHEVAAAHKVVEKMENSALLARKILERNLADYATMHYEGARVAAEKGDTRPAEWALTHAKVEGQAAVEPPTKLSGDTGTRVLIGIRVGSMPTESLDAEIISVPDEPQ